MSLRRLLVRSHLLALVFLNSLFAVQHRIIISKITSTVDPNFGNISFTLVDSKFSFYFYNKFIVENAVMSAEMNVKTTVDGMYTNLFTKRLNVCEFLANPTLDPLIYFGYKALTKDKNNKFFTKCPLKVVRYYLTWVNRFNNSYKVCLIRRVITTSKIIPLTFLMYRYQFTTWVLSFFLNWLCPIKINRYLRA